MLYEIAKRERTSPEVVLKGLPEDAKTFAAVKQWLVHRRFPELTSHGILIRESFPAVDIAAENRMDVGHWPEISPKTVYVERAAQGSVLAQRLADLFPAACFEAIESYRQFAAGKIFTTKDYNRRLETFFVVQETFDFFKPCPCTPAARSCGYHNVNLGFGCPFECSYCFLQNYTNAPGIVLPANLDDFFQAFAGYRQDVRVGSGETTDSLALDLLTGFSPEIVEFFRRRPQSLFEFKTKSDNIANLLSVKAASNIVVAWSVNPQRIIDQEEFFTASLEERLRAASRCAAAGYSTAFHFDPIVAYAGWERDYEEVVERLFAVVPEESVRWISLGTLRMTPEQKKMIENRFPENTILDAELLTCPDGKVRYHESVRCGIYRKMVQFLRRHTRRGIVYLCMEPIGMWREVGVNLDSPNC